MYHIICGYCGFVHAGMCPKIHEIEYYPDGTIKKIGFAEMPDYFIPPVTMVTGPTWQVFPDNIIY